MTSAQCVAHDLHTVAPGSFERTSWRQFLMQGGDCKRSWIAPPNVNIITIIIIIIVIGIIFIIIIIVIIIIYVEQDQQESLGASRMSGACAWEYWRCHSTAAVWPEGHRPACSAGRHQRRGCWQVSEGLSCSPIGWLDLESTNSKSQKKQKKKKKKSVFCILVFAPVQRSWACFTWKGALEIHSFFFFFLLLLFSSECCRLLHFTSLHLGVVHPLQDVALHQCLPLLPG